MTKQEIVDILNSDKQGFYIGTRLILPFRCNLIKLIADSHIFTEFVGSEHVKIAQTEQNTSIYFREMGRLKELEDSYKSIKIVIASEQADLTDMDNHIKVICHILDHHHVELEVPGPDDLFIE
jgi:hypothetical protein